MKRNAAGIRLWAAALLACAAATVFSFARLDVPTAMRFRDAIGPLSRLGQGLGADVLLSVESLALLIIVLVRLVKGHIPKLGEVAAVACLASMCAYVVNDHILKVLCGVPGPRDVVQGARHGFNLLMGSPGSSFPSGHMALAGAFAGVFMSFYRASLWPLAALLLLAAGLLVVGDWHFLSDIIAGAFVGLTAGLLAAQQFGGPPGAPLTRWHFLIWRL